jgi:hypothetical protein
MTNPAVSEIEREAHRNISEKRRDVMYDDQSEKGDSFRQEFQSAIEEIERYLKPKLQY